MFNHQELFTKALGLQEPWKVDRVEFNQDNGQLDLYISRRRGSKHPCPHCKTECGVHDTKKRTWRHLNFFQYKAYIHCDVPRIKCKEHGVVQIEVPWSRPDSGFTMLLEALIIQLSTVMPVNSVAKLIGEYDTRLWRVINHYVAEARKKEDFSEVTNVGIDETSSKKGHNYVSVFVDLDESRVIYATEGRNSKTVDRFKEDLKEHRGSPEKIENICCDMSPAFIKGVEENFINADITFDKFHVMQAVNKAVDEVRRQEQAQNNFLKNTRYIWLKNPENLGSLSTMNLKTARAYNIKLTLQQFWEIQDLDTAVAFLKKWYFWATHSRLKPIKDVAYLIKRHWTSSRINNGILEGLNSLIQATKRKARGYRNTKNLISIIYLTCSRLQMDLPKAFV